MIKLKTSLTDRVKNLTELEFSALFEELAEHIKKNNWQHIVHNHFENYEDEFEDMQEDRNHWMDRAKKAESTIDQIRDIV